MLCATIKNAHVEEIERANRLADLIEFRLDLFSSSQLACLRNLATKPVIFKLDSPDFEKLGLLPDYVDLPWEIEAACFEEIALRFPSIKRICSYHNFQETGDLDVILKQMQSKPADMYKIATFARSTLDALRMLLFVKKSGCLGLCMGAEGRITRILARYVGAPWMYAPLSIESQTASGQILLEELKQIYHADRLTCATKLYGLIGDPVDKSVGHIMHNEAFRRIGLNGVYVKMRLTEEEVEEGLSLMEQLGFKGLSVTMPLKETVRRTLDRSCASSINTIAFRSAMRWGWNTDGEAVLDLLEAKRVVRGAKIALIGAGGVAQGIAAEAKKRGCELVIANRDETRAKNLARTVGGKAFALAHFDQLASEGYDILVNCTSVGMQAEEALPVDPSLLLEKRLVMDVISNPRHTLFLQAAIDKGCTVIDGMEMFVLQAKLQHKLWGLNNCG